VKKYKPTSAGRRGMTVVSYREVLTTKKNEPLKSLTKADEVPVDVIVRDVPLTFIEEVDTSEHIVK